MEAAARAVKAGWAKEKVLEIVGSISQATDALFTLAELKYLIHGGRISHMKGLVASVLNIKPVIGVEKVQGTYAQMGFCAPSTKPLRAWWILSRRNMRPVAR